MRHASRKLTGVFAATALFAVVSALLGLRYAGTGDALILKAFAGYQGGVPVHFHEELHTALGWLLFALQSVVPTIPWFSALQLAFLWLACAAMVGGLSRCARQNSLPAWLGGVGGLVLFGAFALFAACRVDHDTTGAVLGAAALARLFAINFQTAADQQVLRGMLCSAGLLIASFCFNQLQGLAALSLWLICVMGVGFTDYSRAEVARRGTAARRGARGLVIGLAICLFCFGLFIALRRIELAAMGDHVQWQSARAALLNNPGFPQRVTDALLSSVGWTQTKLSLVSSGYLFDSSITAESLQALNAGLSAGAPAALSERLFGALHSVGRLMTESPAVRWGAWLALGLLVFCFLSQVLHRKPGAWRYLAPALTALLMAGWLLWFSMDGALLLSEALTVLFTGSVALLGYALRALTSRVERWKRLLCGLALLLMAALCAGGCAANVTAAAALKAENAPFEETLDSYAASKPDKLIFYSPSLVEDTRLFPDLRAVPVNLVLPDARMFHTDGLNDQLALFGLDGRELAPKDFLHDFVLVAGTEKGPWSLLLPYVSESVTGTLNWALYDTSEEVYLYRLCRR